MAHKLLNCHIFFFLCREREALGAENEARYQALKMRWKELVQTYQPPVESDVPESIPLYLKECQACNSNLNQAPNHQSESSTGAEQKSPVAGEDQLVFLTLTAKVGF